MAMKIACLLTPCDDRNLTLASQVGVEEIVSVFPGIELESLRVIKDRVENKGMQLTTIERLIPHHKIVHRLPGHEQQTDVFKQLIRNMGELGLKTLCYNWMPSEDWHRTSVDVPERGSALVTEFKLSEKAYVPRSHEHDSSEHKTSADELWNNLLQFQKEVLPIAEQCHIDLAIHPDDPPVESIEGQDQILTSPDALLEATQLVESERNGLCFCQGTFASRGNIDISDAIGRLASKIKFIHFRDVVGEVPVFREAFHDTGKTDMAACWQAYEQAGLDDIPIRPDHVPTMAGESNEHPGYEMQGRLFAVGYMKGLQDSAASNSGNV